MLGAIENPADIEARGRMLIASTLAGCAFAQTGTAGAHSIGHALATLAAAVDLLLLVAVVHTALLMRNRLERFLQTLSAAIGTGVLLAAVAWVVVVVLEYAGLPLLPVLLVVIWNVVGLGEILKHALELPRGAGIAIAIGYVFLSILVQGIIIPAPAAAGT